MADRPPRDPTAAERARRYRDRQRRAWAPRIVVPIEVAHFDTVNALLDDGRITDGQAHDRDAIAAALGQIIEAWQKTVTRDAAEPVGWVTLKGTKEKPE